MILKYLTKLSQMRTPVLLSLILPVFLVVFFSKYQIAIMPESPFLRYEIDILAPTMSASEIENKVTEVSEKILNGLPNLLSLNSITHHEKAKIQLMFKTGSKEGQTFLFIQEKLDRLKILLPEEVKSVQIQQKKIEHVPDLRFTNLDFERVQYIYQKLFAQRKAIMAITPDLQLSDIGQHSFQIRPDLDKLIQNKVGLDQFWKAIKLNSFTYNLGQKRDLSYFVHGDYKSVEELKSVVIGASGTYIIRLGDVADVSLMPFQIPEHIDVRVNQNELGLPKLLMWTLQNFKKNKGYIKIQMPFAKAFLKSLLRPTIFVVVILLLQYILTRSLFKNMIAFLSFLVLDAIITLHYLFWISLSNNTITTLDLYTLVFLIILTSYYWSILLGRFRSYFFPSTLHTAVKRELSQAVLFTLAEYLPTILVSIFIIFIFAIPIILSDINVVSQVFLKNFLLPGVPVLLMTLVVLSLFSPLKWIISNAIICHENHRFNWLEKTQLINSKIVLSLVLTFILSVASWYFLDFGIKSQSMSGETKLTHFYRGYGEGLPYHIPPVQNNTKSIDNFLVDTEHSWSFQFLMVFSITEQGLNILSKVDSTSFKMALKDFLSSESLSSHINIEGQHKNQSQGPSQFIIKTVMPKLDFFQFGKLPLTNDNNSISTLSQFTNVSILNAPSQIFRSQLGGWDEGVIKEEIKTRRSVPILKNNLPTDGTQTLLKPSPIATYISENYELYKRHFAFAFLFLFIILSLYLNSFIRSGILILMGTIFLSSYPLLKSILNSSFHLDSLYLLSFPITIFLFSILFLSRSVDTERSRGNDRTLVFKEVQIIYLPVVFYSGLFTAASLTIIGTLELLMSKRGVGAGFLTYYEAAGLGIVSILSTYFGCNQFFKLYYLNAQAFFEKIMIKIFLIYYRFRYKKYHSLSRNE